MTPSRVRIVVVDDHPVFREGMVRALLDTGRYVLAGEAADGMQACELIARERPDVALLDLRMPELDGLGVLRRLDREGVAVRVVLLTAFPHPALIAQARDAGAAAFLSKDTARQAIIAMLDAVAAGAHGIFEPGSDERPQLMDIEIELLSFLRAGWSVHELPAVADLPRSRVERYLTDAIRKLAAEDLDDAIASAVAWGLVNTVPGRGA
jgi:two-component system nitrate/nitrite response regulator NarL